MPCFFFISGWLLRDRHIDDLKTGMRRKVRSSYWSFVKWQLIFLAAHNLFSALHIYGDEGYSLTTFGVRVLRTLTMTGGEQLLGGYWFLISLFWASVVSLLFFKWSREREVNVYLQSGGVILVLLAAALEYRLPFNLPSQFGEQTILAVAFYMSGYLLKKAGFNFRQPAYRGLLLLALPAVVALFTHMGMVSGVAGWKVFAYYPVAMAGTIGTLVVSSCVSRVPLAKRVLGYIGSRTLYVLTFHFLAFKLVSYVYISFTARSLTDLAQSPVVQADEAWLWLAYSLVGTVLPFAVWELLNTFPAKLKAMVKTRITDKNNQI